MKGIDISGWQKGIKLDKIDHDFVIIKATQGAKMTSNSFADQASQAFALGKKVGFYHYAGGGGAEAEAKHFIEVVKPYLGRAILVLDWEGQENPNFGNSAYAIDLLAQIKKLSGGITPFIYMSKSYVRQWAAAWATIAKEVPLWCAQYANNQITGYQENPWRTSGLIWKMFTALISLTAATEETSADFLENTATRFKKIMIEIYF